MDLAVKSRRLTWVAYAMAAAAFVGVIAYLRPNETQTWPNALVALVVLAAPLAARGPATMLRLVICSAIWAGAGIPGAYVFGSPVFYAGCLLGVVVAARLFLWRERSTVSG